MASAIAGLAGGPAATLAMPLVMMAMVPSGLFVGAVAYRGTRFGARE